MNLDQLARDAARDARQAGQRMPVVPIEGLRRRRFLWITPLVGVGLAAAIALIFLLVPAGDPIPPADEAPPPTTLAPTTTLPVTTTVPEVVIPDTDWVRGTSEQIIDDGGEVLFEFPSTILFGRNTAWDGGDGFVALTGEGLIWMRPGQSRTIDLPQGAIVDVAISDSGTHVVGIARIEDRTVHWYELETGDLVDPPATARTLDGRAFVAGDRMATIEDPDWNGVERDETGAPLPPFDLPELVVTEGRFEVLRIPVGSFQKPFAEIHDFDGRRIVFGALPIEPAVPPTTVWIVDLECSECTQRFDTPSLEYFDLIGDLPSEGAVVEPVMP